MDQLDLNEHDPISEKSYPGYKSPFFTNLATNQNKRMEKEPFHVVVDRVRSLYSKISPRGCSQNNRIQYEDVDRARDLIKARETNLQKFTECETKKLNNPLRISSCKNSKKPMSIDLTLTARRIKVEGNVQALGMKYRKKSADSVIGRCEAFRSEIQPKKNEIISHGLLRRNTANLATNFIQDLSVCLKYSPADQEKIKNMMSTMGYNRNTDIALKNELKQARAGLLNITDKLVRMSGYKLWRQNNIAFMSIADKMIYSFPMIKN